MIMNWAEESKGGDFQVYPEGTYKVVINGYEKTKAQTGTEQIKWKAQILEPKEFVGKPVTLFTPLTEKALWKLARMVKGCGIDMHGLGKMDTNGKAFFNVLDNCLRRTTFWHLSEGIDNKGNPRNEIDDFKLDTEQDIIPVGNEEDTPEFLKGA